MRFVVLLIAVVARAGIVHAQPTDDAPPPEAPVGNAPPPIDAAPPPPPPPVVAPAGPALPEGVAPLGGERPARFFLTGGNTFVATRIGEDPEYFWVTREDGSLARVRKSEIARVTYELSEAAPVRREPERPPSLLPLEEEEGERAGGRAPGRGLIVGGAVLFGIFYGGTLLFAPSAEGPGGLLLIPIGGPLIYGLAREASSEDVGGLAVVTALQGAGALMLFLGLRQAASASAENPRRRAEHGALLVLVPELSMRRVGILVASTF